MITKEEANIWRRIKAIPFRNWTHLNSHLRDHGYRIGSVAEKVFKKIPFDKPVDGKEICLVCLSLRDLGFRNKATLRQILNAAEKEGFKVCPSELVPSIRLGYVGPSRDFIYIGMDPSDEGEIFSLVNDLRAKWIIAPKVDEMKLFQLFDHFIFIID